MHLDLKDVRCGYSLVVKQVKNQALLLQWLWSLLWYEFSPWPRNFCMLWVQPKKKENYKILLLGAKERLGNVRCLGLSKSFFFFFFFFLFDFLFCIFLFFIFFWNYPDYKQF